MDTYLLPDVFIEKVTRKIYDGLNHKFNVKISICKEDLVENPVAVPMFIIAKDMSQPFMLPATQAYIEYVNTFNGNFNRFCEDICKRVEEFHEFTHSQEEICYEM